MADVLVSTGSHEHPLHAAGLHRLGVLVRWTLVLAAAAVSFLAVSSGGAGFIAGLVVALVVFIIGMHPWPRLGSLL